MAENEQVTIGVVRSSTAGQLNLPLTCGLISRSVWSSTRSIFDENHITKRIGHRITMDGSTRPSHQFKRQLVLGTVQSRFRVCCTFSLGY